MRKVAYLMPLPELGGGNIAIFDHARLLQSQGVEVTVLAAGPRPEWASYSGRYIDYSGRGEAASSVASLQLEPQSLVVATYWTTIELALELDIGPVAHFCQGYEGDLSHLADHKGAIESAYSRPLPTLAVTPHLADFVSQRFGRPARVVSPAVAPWFRPRRRLAPRRKPWIVVPGVFEAEVKGVAAALAAVGSLRSRGLACRVLRYSALPRSEEERKLLQADRFLHAVSPLEIAHALRTCDLLLFASEAAEGFGLPVLEAMASGVPVIAYRIPSLDFMAQGGAVLLEERSTETMVQAAYRLIGSRRLWRRARRAGFVAAAKFAEPVIASRLLEGVNWAIDHFSSTSRR